MSKVDLAKYNNDWYQPGSAVKRFIWFICGHTFINSYLPLPSSIRCRILRVFGAKIGENVVIKPKVNIKYPWFLSIGKNAWIGEEVWIDNLTQVNIGANACISQGAMLLTGNHNYKSPAFDLMIGEINLEEGVWIGAKAVVCPGVTCLEHAMLGAGGVLSKDMGKYEVWSGNPATFLKNRQIS